MGTLQMRYLTAGVITVVALLVLGLGALFGGDDAAETQPGADATTSTTEATTTSQVTASTTTTSIAIRPDWYPKQTSRYSDRQPIVTVSTLPPTTTEAPEDDTGSAGSTSRSGAGSTRSSSSTGRTG